jgi:hypothetical protein
VRRGSGTDPMMAVESVSNAPLRTGSILASAGEVVEEQLREGGKEGSNSRFDPLFHCSLKLLRQQPVPKQTFLSTQPTPAPFPTIPHPSPTSHRPHRSSPSFPPNVSRSPLKAPCKGTRRVQERRALALPLFPSLLSLLTLTQRRNPASPSNPSTLMRWTSSWEASLDRKVRLLLSVRTQKETLTNERHRDELRRRTVRGGD